MVLQEQAEVPAKDAGITVEGCMQRGRVWVF